MKESKTIEVLAPGGSKEAIYAGLQCGADAVYTGTSKFSARAFAENPTVEELCEIIDYAHLHRKKIYLTVNTLLSEAELENQLYDMIVPLYQRGLDAVIVQDLGVMDFIHHNFPDMDIHASTQMSFVTGEAMNLLKPYGVTRVVPARELSIDEIRDVRGQTDMELEVFVHGALCYSYSGQCLMSKVIGGRSGNRGMCAQPCRLPFETEDGKRGYLISTKDLCTLEHVGELIDAGVDSFKIEGRMKKPVYTAYTAHLYRTYADAHLAGLTISDRELRRDLQRLQDIYNRGGFCGGYLFEKQKKNIMFPKKNGHYGVCVGEVVKVNKHTVEYKVLQPTQYQDVVEFRNHREESVYEYTIKEGAVPGDVVTARYKPGSELQKGQKVYRTKNASLIGEIEDMMDRGKKMQKVPVIGRFVAKEGEPISFEVSHDTYGITVTDVVAEPAKKQGVSSEEVERRLLKTGDSLFQFASLEVDVEENLFFPMGRVSALRRDAFEQLQNTMEQWYHRSFTLPQREENREMIQPNILQKRLVVTICKDDQWQGICQTNQMTPQNTVIHLKLDEWSPACWETVAAHTGEFDYYVSLPTVLRKKNKNIFEQAWKKYGSCFEGEHFRGFIIHSLEAIPLIENLGLSGKEKIAGTGMYLWNERTRQVWNRFGIQGGLYLAYGRNAVMNTEGCVGNLLSGCSENQKVRKQMIMTPKKDRFVVINTCQYCYNTIYEADATWQEQESLAGIPEIRFLDEQAEEVRKVLEQWNFLS